MLRNREFRQLAILFSLIAATTITLGFAINRLGGILAIASASAFGTAFLRLPKPDIKVLRRFQIKSILCFITLIICILVNQTRANFPFCKPR